MIRFLLSCVAWSVGMNPPSGTGSSGFGEEQLAPSRERNALERAVALLSTLLFFTSTVRAFIDLGPLNFLHGPESFACAIPSALWALQTIVRPSLPVDRTAIAVGLWTFGPYVPLFLLGEMTLIPLTPLLWQMGGFLVLTLGCIIRDVRRQMTSEN